MHFVRGDLQNKNFVCRLSRTYWNFFCSWVLSLFMYEVIKKLLILKTQLNRKWIYLIHSPRTPGVFLLIFISTLGEFFPWFPSQFWLHCEFHPLLSDHIKSFCDFFVSSPLITMNLFWFLHKCCNFSRSLIAL